MDRNRRKELQEAYKEIKTMMGVVQITNKLNGKRFIDSYPNLKNKWSTLKMQLNIGMFPNPGLQTDWKKSGVEAFEFEILEEKEVKEDTDARWEIKQMEKYWLEQIQPFGDNGYHKQVKS